MVDDQSPTDSRLRLQKVLASAGLGSRRQCEELILEGRVDVDREVVTVLGTRVDPATQSIRVDGVPLKQSRTRYFAVHKPPGVVSTARDQWQRTRVIDLVDARERLFTIGRLDMESSGLILVTNDGDLANKLTHPRYRVEKVYHVTVAGHISPDVLRKLRQGIHLSDGKARPESVVIKKRLKASTLLEIVLAEGRNREIRRMLARVEHKVMKLHRVAIGSIRLGMLPSGAHRELTMAEVKALRNLSTKKGTTKKRRHTTRTTAPGARRQSKPIKKTANRLGTVIGEGLVSGGVSHVPSSGEGPRGTGQRKSGQKTGQRSTGGKAGGKPRFKGKPKSKPGGGAGSGKSGRRLKKRR